MPADELDWRAALASADEAGDEGPAFADPSAGPALLAIQSRGRAPGLARHDRSGRGGPAGGWPIQGGGFSDDDSRQPAPERPSRAGESISGTPKLGSDLFDALAGKSGPPEPLHKRGFYPAPFRPLEALLKSDGDRIRKLGTVWEPTAGDGAILGDRRLGALAAVAPDRLAD